MSLREGMSKERDKGVRKEESEIERKLNSITAKGTFPTNHNHSYRLVYN